jgi:hypothetical protein
MKEPEKGGCYRSTELAIIVPRACWRKIFREPRRKTTNRHAGAGRR